MARRLYYQGQATSTAGRREGPHGGPSGREQDLLRRLPSSAPWTAKPREPAAPGGGQAVGSRFPSLTAVLAVDSTGCHPAGQGGTRVEGTPSTPPRKSSQGQLAGLAASKASLHGRLPQFRALEWVSGQGSRGQRGQGPPLRPTSYHCKPELASDPEHLGNCTRSLTGVETQNAAFGDLGPSAKRCAGATGSIWGCGSSSKHPIERGSIPVL